MLFRSVVDTTGIAKGSADATKIVRFEVDGLTTATTRVLTVPDKDITIADNADVNLKANIASPTFTGNVNIEGELTISGASRVRGTKTTVQTIVTVTNTVVQWNSKNYDNLNEFDAVTNYRFTATKAGYYAVYGTLLSASVAWATGGLWTLMVRKNGTEYIQGCRNIKDSTRTDYFPSFVYTQLYLAANDYIEFLIRHNRGSDTNTYADTDFNHFAIHRLS